MKKELKIEKIERRFGDNSPFVYFFFLLLIVHLILPLNWADDKVFAVKVVGKTLFEFIRKSARPVSDAMTYIFTKCYFAWRILDPLVLVLFAYFVSVLIPVKDENRRKTNIILCCSLIFPSIIAVDAGFVATTLNYLWPALCGAYVLLGFRQLALGQKVKWYSFLLSIPAMVYASNMQQLGAVYILAFFGFTLYFIAKRKKVYFYALFQLILCSVCTLYAYLINIIGTNNRMERETGRYFIEFGNLNLLQKLELGFSSTFYGLTVGFRFAFFAFLIFTLYLLVCVFKQNLRKPVKICACFPIAFSLIASVINYLPIRSMLFGEFVNARNGKATYAFEILPDIFYCLAAICVLYVLYNLLDKKRFLVSFSLLFLALISRLIMGFSPTVWASGYRTFFIMFVVFAVIAVILYDYVNSTDVYCAQEHGNTKKS